VSALDQWLADTQAEVKTEDGHILTVVPVRIQDCIIAGAIPLPVLEEMAKLEADAAEGETTAADRLETMKTAHHLNDVYVRLSITHFDGEPIEMTPAAVQRLGAAEPAAYDEVVALATRREQPPGED